MGLLSIFNRKKTAAEPSRPNGRGAAKARAATRGSPAAAMAPADAAEAFREARARARRRLMGATVLLLVGVIGFPLMFETQPRPIPVDLPIDIPQRNAGASTDAGSAQPTHGARGASGGAIGAALPHTASSAAETESVSYDNRPPAATAQVPRAQVAATAAQPDAPPPAAMPSRPAPAASKPAAPASRPAPPPTAPAPAPAPTHVAQAAPPATPSASSTAAAAALLDAPNPTADRYVVQVAAFKPADDAKIRDIRGRVEKLGLKTYTQPVETPGGKWIRVRVGPYPTKAEADSAVAKIAAAGLGLQPKVYMP